jgi:hypothetical protein
MEIPPFLPQPANVRDSIDIHYVKCGGDFDRPNRAGVLPQNERLTRR